ncbi:hypothetical protein G9A89_005585 [Geosiphon pyriformis]|nr:hypothetical protein G9A89_005585 [Geosiphon pyriformis]
MDYPSIFKFSSYLLKRIATEIFYETDLAVMDKLGGVNIIDYLQENESNHSESLESKETESEPEKITENKEEMATAYIAKIPEFISKDNDTSSQEWLDKVQKAEDANSWIAARMLKAILYFLQGTAGEWFENLEESFENWQAFKDVFLQQFTDNNTSITLCNYFHNIKQETSETILNQFIAGLKDKLIKKVCPHAPADLATAIRHVKNYEMAIKEANHTKLINLAIGETSLTAEKKIDQLTKKDTENEIVENYKETNKTGVINVTLHHNNLITNLHHQPIIHQDHKIKTQPLPIQPYQTPPTQQYQNNNNRINPNNQLVPQNSGQQKPNYYHTQPSYLTIPEESDFQQSALSEANESLFLLSNAAANEQKVITAMYTEVTVEEKLLQLILDSGSAGTQTVIVIADGMKKTPVREIDNFPFTIDGITIPVKVLVIDKLKILYQRQYTIISATCSTFNKRSEKAPVFKFEEEKEMLLTETYMALGSTSNWKVRYSTSEPQKQPPYIPLKCKDCNKKLSSMGACIFPEEEYETHIYNTPCLTCGDMLLEEYNWIDVAIRGGVCDQTCQYALSISEKVRKRTSFDTVYNSVFNKLYHYPHDAEMIFDLAMALINKAIQEDYTMELAGFDYEDEVETYHQITSHTYST